MLTGWDAEYYEKYLVLVSEFLYSKITKREAVRRLRELNKRFAKLADKGTRKNYIIATKFAAHWGSPRPNDKVPEEVDDER